MTTSASVIPDDAEETKDEETKDEETKDEETEEAFTPHTAEKVDWVLGKVADRRAAAARTRENAKMMAHAEDREADALEWRFSPALQAFTRKQLEGGKRSSVRLYNGILGYRAKPAGVSVTDPFAPLS